MQPQVPSPILHPRPAILDGLLDGFGQSRQVDVRLPELSLLVTSWPFLVPPRALRRGGASSSSAAITREGSSVLYTTSSGFDSLFFRDPKLWYRRSDGER